MVASPPYLAVDGSYREIGRQIGEGVRERVRWSLAFYEEDFAELAGVPLAAAWELAQPYPASATRHLAQHVEELQGLAEGAGVSFGALFVANCGEEFQCGSRPARAAELLDLGLETVTEPLALTAGILADHADASHPICAHPDRFLPLAEQTATTSSVAWEDPRRQGHLCASPPCSGRFEVFDLS